MIIDYQNRSSRRLGVVPPPPTPSRGSCRAPTASASPTASRPDRRCASGRSIRAGSASATRPPGCAAGWLVRARAVRGRAAHPARHRGAGERFDPVPGARPPAGPVARLAAGARSASGSRARSGGRASARRSREVEWPRIRADIDAGRLVDGRSRAPGHGESVRPDQEPPGPRVRLRGRGRRGDAPDLRPELAGAGRRHDHVRGGRRASASRRANRSPGSSGSPDPQPRLDDRVDHLDEERHEIRVELATGLAEDLQERRLDLERRSIRAVVDHRVEGVDEADDPGTDRDRLAAQPVRVAEAVPALVVVADDRGEERELGNERQMFSPMTGWRRIAADSSWVSGPASAGSSPGRRGCRCRG